MNIFKLFLLERKTEMYKGTRIFIDPNHQQILNLIRRSTWKEVRWIAAKDMAIVWDAGEGTHQNMFGLMTEFGYRNAYDMIMGYSGKSASDGHMGFWGFDSDPVTDNEIQDLNPRFYKALERTRMPFVTEQF